MAVHFAHPSEKPTRSRMSREIIALRGCDSIGSTDLSTVNLGNSSAALSASTTVLSTFLANGSHGEPLMPSNSALSHCFSGCGFTAALLKICPSSVEIKCSSVPHCLPSHTPRSHLGCIRPPCTFMLTLYRTTHPNSSITPEKARPFILSYAVNPSLPTRNLLSTSAE